MKNILMMAVVSVFAFIAACAPIPKEAKLELKKGVNCATADSDLQILQSEKVNVAQQMANAVMAATPPGIVIGILTGTENDKILVATGDYNDMLDKKIAEIKAQCYK
jgi:hypothetical protein